MMRSQGPGPSQQLSLPLPQASRHGHPTGDGRVVMEKRHTLEREREKRPKAQRWPSSTKKARGATLSVPHHSDGVLGRAGVRVWESGVGAGVECCGAPLCIVGATAHEEQWSEHDATESSKKRATL